MRRVMRVMGYGVRGTGYELRVAYRSMRNTNKQIGLVGERTTVNGEHF